MVVQIFYKTPTLIYIMHQNCPPRSQGHYCILELKDTSRKTNNNNKYFKRLLGKHMLEVQYLLIQY